MTFVSSSFLHYNQLKLWHKNFTFGRTAAKCVNRTCIEWLDCFKAASLSVSVLSSLAGFARQSSHISPFPSLSTQLLPLSPSRRKLATLHRFFKGKFWGLLERKFWWRHQVCSAWQLGLESDFENEWSRQLGRRWERSQQ